MTQAHDADKAQTPKPELSPEAKRALAEAKAREAERAGKKTEYKQKDAAEHGGPKGLEPTRYGDWERKGISTDF